MDSAISPAARADLLSRIAEWSGSSADRGQADDLTLVVLQVGAIG